VTPSAGPAQPDNPEASESTMNATLPTPTLPPTPATPLLELPPPAEREHIHTRRTTTRGYRRADGLWDLDGELLDTKTYDSTSSSIHPRKAGDAWHHMLIRLTIDDAMVVRAAVAAMPATPFAECKPASLPMDGLVGAQIGPGWRRAVNTAMGGVAGCTHLRELLSAMATVAFQTIGPYQSRQRRASGAPAYPGNRPAHHMGQCLGWDFDGPVIARVAPQFIGWRPKPDQSVPGAPVESSASSNAPDAPGSSESSGS